LATLVAVAALAGCSGYYSDFDIINETKVEVRDLSVSAGPNVWKGISSLERRRISTITLRERVGQ
jgi:hypothetical protein